ncbi:hypothetical protein ABLO16_01890 [Mycobacterium tuberculosis]
MADATPPTSTSTHEAAHEKREKRFNDKCEKTPCFPFLIEVKHPN